MVVAGSDDLCELRQATAGASLARDPAERAMERFAGTFVLEARRDVREERELDEAQLQDLLRISYCGQRLSEAERVANLEAMAITADATLLHLRPAGAISPARDQ
jgi:hypothetical protein